MTEPGALERDDYKPDPDVARWFHGFAEDRATVNLTGVDTEEE